MKVFIAVLVLIFSLQSLTKADDVRDFQIEGMSIGDSALDFFSEEKIKSNKRNWYKDKKFYGVKIKIQSITAFAYYPNKIDKCYDAQLTLSKEFETVFPNTKKEIFEYNNKHDPHGQSTEKDIVFIFDDGSEAGIACLDWGENYTKQNNSEDHMQVFLDTKGYADWLKGPAYK